MGVYCGRCRCRQGGTLASKAEAATGRRVLLEGAGRVSTVQEGFALRDRSWSSASLLLFAAIPLLATRCEAGLHRLATISWGSSGLDLKFFQSAAAVHAGSCIHKLVRGWTHSKPALTQRYCTLSCWGRKSGAAIEIASFCSLYLGSNSINSKSCLARR